MQIQPARLRNDLTNVVFPEQDLDLVVTRSDGKPESVEELRAFQTWLASKFPYTLEGKSKWDVIGLKTTDGKHMAVEGNPDFARQNNDSLSIGMIELTEPPHGESVIREADHIAKTGSVFLNDLAGDSMHFLESPVHATTEKAASGNNPEIMGVIRTLTKAFQFEKTISPEELERMKKIIDQFDPNQIPANSYARNWIQARGKRLISHAYDPEEALEVLKSLGLLKKLNQIGGDNKIPGSLAWWLNKAPLPIRSTSQASTGKTASELGITQVAHETSAPAHRLISWRYDGLPRGFVSRKEQPGELAEYGNGFYSQKGANAANFQKNQSTTTVIFDVNPDAVEGRDFVQLQNDGVLWKNGAKLQARAEIKAFTPDVTSNCFYRYEANANRPKPTIKNVSTGLAIIALSVGSKFYFNKKSQNYGCYALLTNGGLTDNDAQRACFDHDSESFKKCVSSALDEDTPTSIAVTRCGSKEPLSKQSQDYAACLKALEDDGCSGFFASEECSGHADIEFIACVKKLNHEGKSGPQAAASCERDN